MHTLRQYIPEAKEYTQRRIEAAAQLEKELAHAKEKYSTKEFAKVSQKLKDDYTAKYSSEFNSIVTRFVSAANAEAGKIKREVEQNRPENYDLKLSNAMKMIESLDGNTIAKNLDAISEAVRPFTFDPLARQTIEQMLAKHGASASWDYGTEKALESLEAAKGFEVHYFDSDLGTNMEFYVNMNFPEETKNDSQKFDFDFSYSANTLNQYRGDVING